MELEYEIEEGKLALAESFDTLRRKHLAHLRYTGHLVIVPNIPIRPVSADEVMKMVFTRMVERAIDTGMFD